jgi:hypothetical protein
MLLRYKQLLHIFHSDIVPHSAPNYRIIWCPYLACYDEEEESADDPEKMFVVLNGDKGRHILTLSLKLLFKLKKKKIFKLKSGMWL